MQIPSIPGHAPNVPPREAGGGEGDHGVPQPPEPIPCCSGCSFPSSLPFPLPGKPDLRGQAGRSRSVSRSSPATRPAPPFQGLLWPLAQAGSWVPAREGEGTLMGSPGEALKAAHPLQSLALGLSELQRLWGTASCTLPSSLCACCPALRQTDRGLVPNTWQGCCKLHSGGIVAKKKQTLSLSWSRGEQPSQSLG